MSNDAIEITALSSSAPTDTSVLTRRTLLRAAAWAVPAVAIAVGTPALAASETDDPRAVLVDPPAGLGWYWAQFQVGNGTAPGNIKVLTKVNLENYGEVRPLLGRITIQFTSYTDKALTQVFRDHTETFEFNYNGTNGESTPDELILFDRNLPLSIWPAPGGELWVRFTMLAMTGEFDDGKQFLIPISPISHPNPFVSTGYVNSGPE